MFGPSARRGNSDADQGWLQHAGAPVFEHVNDFAAPVLRLSDLRRSAIFEHRVERQIKDLFLVVDVPIKAHRARSQAIGQPTHRQSVYSFGVQQFDRGRHDAFQRERRFTAAAPARTGVTHLPVETVCFARRYVWLPSVFLAGQNSI